MEINPELTLLGEQAKQASLIVATAGPEAKNRALQKIADTLSEHAGDILAANALDVARARKEGVKKSVLSRLILTPEQINSMSDGVRDIIRLPDPVERGEIWTRLRGLRIKRTGIPLDVAGIIYEARPTATVDAAALCLKSGCACLLCGGSQAAESNKILVELISEAIRAAGLPAAAVQLVPAGDCTDIGWMMWMNSLVDVLIPRGDTSLIRSVVAHATVPVISARTEKGAKAPGWNMWQALFILLLYYIVPIPFGGEIGPEQSFFAHFFTYCGRFVVGVGLIWGGLTLLKGSWAQLGVGKFRLRHGIIGIGAGLGLAFSVSVVMILVSSIFGPPIPQSIELVLQGGRNPFQIVIISLCAVVLMPIVEELLFRGMLYPPIRKVCGPVQAVLLVALIFAAIHGDVLRFLPLLAAGVGLTWLFEKTRSLWPGIVAHGVWNLVMVVVVLWQGR